VFEAVVFNEGVVGDLAEGAEADEVVIVEGEVTAVGVVEAAVVEEEVVPIQSSSRTDIRAYSSQKAKTTCW
jgi:hypothetical protein